MDDNKVVGIEIGKCVRFKLKVKIVQEFMVENVKGTVFSFFLHFLLVFLAFFFKIPLFSIHSSSISCLSSFKKMYL